MAVKQLRKTPTNLLWELLGSYWPSIALWRCFEADLLQRIDYRLPLLDLGCGQGLFSRTIFSSIEVGLDTSRRDLRVAKSLGLYQKLHCCSARKIPYSPGYFGSVLANCVIEHIPDPATVIKEVSRVLKKRGIFICTVPSESFSQMLLLRAPGYVAYRNQYLAHYSLYPPSKWEKIFAQYGLKLKTKVKYLDSLTLKIWDALELIRTPFLWGKSPGLKIWEITPKFLWQLMLTWPLSFLLRRRPKGKSGGYLLMARKA